MSVTMKLTVWLAGTLALAPAISALPPAGFGFPQSEGDAQLSVHYQVNGSSIGVQPGALFGINVPAQAPTIAINESYPSVSGYTGQYLFFMVDPDASYPQNPTSRWIIHWWQTNLVKSTTQVNNNSIGGTALVNTTAPRVAYRRPAPPTNSSAHRYIQYLFKQPADFQVPAAYSGYGGMNASRFPFDKFVVDANLGAPVAANYFYCSNQSVVPSFFNAGPGQQYPGGNGDMITEGTNLPSATSAMASATGSRTSSGVPASTYTGMATVSSRPGGLLILLMTTFNLWLLL